MNEKRVITRMQLLERRIRLANEILDGRWDELVHLHHGSGVSERATLRGFTRFVTQLVTQIWNMPWA